MFMFGNFSVFLVLDTTTLWPELPKHNISIKWINLLYAFFMNVPSSSLLQNKSGYAWETLPFNRMALKIMFLICLGFFQNSISIDNDIEIELRFGNLSDVLGFKISGGQDSSNEPLTVSTLTFLVYMQFHIFKVKIISALQI